MAEIYQLPEGNGNGNSGIPFSIPIGLGGFGNGGFGFRNGGFNSIADLFGLAIIASMFGWGNGGFGGGFGNWGGNAGQLGFLSNQLNNDSGRELIMNAITSNGEATRTAVQSLATNGIIPFVSVSPALIVFLPSKYVKELCSSPTT